MNLESLNNKVDRRVKVAHKKSDLKEVGSYLKRKRKELKITQDEIAKGICSISYLSKIENNQIVPKEFYVKELFSRMNINEDVYQKTINDTLYLEKIMDGLFYYDEDMIDEVFTDIEMTKNNITLNIAKLLYYTYYDKSEGVKLLNSLENLITNMDTYELKVYLLVSSIYYIKKAKYKKALRILINNRKLVYFNEKLEALIYYYQYISKQNIGLINSSHEDFYKYINLSNQYHNEFRKINIVLIKLSFIVEENPVHTLTLLNEMSKKSLSAEQLNFYYLIKGQSYIELNKFEESVKTLNLIDTSSKHTISKDILIFQIGLIKSDDNLINQVIDNIRKYKFDKITLKHKILFELLSIKDESDLKKYLKEIAIPYSIEVEDVRNIKKYTYMVMEICCNKSRYKEASQHFKKYKKELKKLIIT